MGSYNIRCRITDIPIEVGDPVVCIDISKFPKYFQEHISSYFYCNFKIYHGFYADYGEIRDENNKRFPIQDRYDKNDAIFIYKEIWEEIQSWAKKNDYSKFEKKYECISKDDQKPGGTINMKMEKIYPYTYKEDNGSGLCI